MQKEDKGSVGSPIADVFSKISYRVLPTLPRRPSVATPSKKGEFRSKFRFYFLETTFS